MSGVRLTARHIEPLLAVTHPDASTDSVVVGISHADLAGTVNPNGVAASAYFEWGVDTSYGQTTTPQSLGSGSSPVAVTDSITGLIGRGSYHFRIVVTYAAGTVVGSDLAFQTMPPQLARTWPQAVARAATW